MRRMNDKELGRVTRLMMAVVLVMWTIAAIIRFGRS